MGGGGGFKTWDLLSTLFICTCALELCGRSCVAFLSSDSHFYPLATPLSFSLFLERNLHLRWRKVRIQWRRVWRSWRRRSPAPFVRSTSATPRSSLASTTTARSASDNCPSEQGPTAPLHAPSAEGELFYLKMTPINCPQRFSSTE